MSVGAGAPQTLCNGARDGLALGKESSRSNTGEPGKGNKALGQMEYKALGDTTPLPLLLSQLPSLQACKARFYSTSMKRENSR